MLLSFLLFYATKWVELITLFHDFYHVVPIKLMTMHYSILYVQLDKGQLISKCPFGVFNSSKKWTKTFDYDTSSQIVFRSSLGII